MGKVARQQEESPLPLETSPRTPSSSNSSTSSSNSNSNGRGAAGGGGGAAAPSAAPPSTPRGVPRPEASPFPTTFVQADPSSFKQVVQMLTGSTETASRHHHQPPAAAADPPSSTTRGAIPPAKTGPKRPAFKLYERRHHSFKNLKAIGPLLMPGGPLSAPGGGAAGFSPRKADILSPSVLDFPALTLSSPVTPLIPDPFNRPPYPNSAAAALAEERAIAEKGFYLHPSPRTTTPRDADPPRLLPLFPVASPRVTSGGPSAAATS